MKADHLGLKILKSEKCNSSISQLSPHIERHILIILGGQISKFTPAYQSSYLKHCHRQFSKTDDHPVSHLRQPRGLRKVYVEKIIYLIIPAGLV